MPFTENSEYVFFGKTIKGNPYIKIKFNDGSKQVWYWETNDWKENTKEREP